MHPVLWLWSGSRILGPYANYNFGLFDVLDQSAASREHRDPEDSGHAQEAAQLQPAAAQQTGVKIPNWRVRVMGMDAEPEKCAATSPTEIVVREALRIDRTSKKNIQENNADSYSSQQTQSTVFFLLLVVVTKAFFRYRGKLREWREARERRRVLAEVGKLKRELKERTLRANAAARERMEGEAQRAPGELLLGAEGREAQRAGEHGKKTGEKGAGGGLRERKGAGG